jgi:hypothetical protein
VELEQFDAGMDSANWKESRKRLSHGKLRVREGIEKSKPGGVFRLVLGWSNEARARKSDCRQNE